VVTAGFLLVPGSGAAARSAYLGGVDLGRYCRAHGYAGASLDGPTAYDWHCRTAAGGRDDLSVIDACRWRYGRATATAHYADMDNPNSWQCWDHVVVLGRVDLDAYCRSLRYSRAALEGRTVGDWRCVAAGRPDVPIDPDSACRWRYGARLRVANVLTYRAPWERWDCWG
jgi:hypothetical protein